MSTRDSWSRAIAAVRVASGEVEHLRATNPKFLFNFAGPPLDWQLDGRAYRQPNRSNDTEGSNPSLSANQFPEFEILREVSKKSAHVTPFCLSNGTREIPKTTRLRREGPTIRCD